MSNRFGFALNIDTKAYLDGVPINFFITIVNRLNEETTLNFSSDPFTFKLISDGNEIYSYTGGPAGDVVVGPRAIYTFDHVEASAPVPSAGATTIQVIGELHSDNLQFSGALTIPIS